MRAVSLLAAASMVASACTGGTPKRITMPDPVVVDTHTPAPGPVEVTPAPRAEKVRELEGITEYRLPNGLQILLFPDQTKSTFTVNVTYFVGSRHEGYGETGMAHLLEHMTFKGTEKYGELLAELETRGAFSNGTTWYDRTNYFETLPASDDNLAFALDLEAERMRKAKMLASDLATEFSVVRSEFEIGENDPFRVLLERVMSAAYLWHNYGKDTIGSRSDIERVPIDNLKAFYDKYYQPDNAMLVVSGKFDPAATLALIEKIYGPIPRPTRTLVDSYTVEPVQDGERTVTLRRNGEVYVLIAAYHAPAGPDPDFVALDAAIDLLTREPSGRLYAPLVKKKLATRLFGFAWPLREPGLVLLGARVRDGKNVPKVKKALLDAAEGLHKSKIKDAEVERYKNDALKNIALSLADSQEVAIELSEWAAMGDWRLIFANRERIKRLTADEVRAAAATYLKASNRTFGEFVPTKDADRAPLKEKPEIAALVDRLQGDAVIEGESFIASLDNLAARTEMKSLAGGIDAALLSKKTRGGTVQLTLTFRHGDTKSLKGKQGFGSATARMAQRGTKKYSFQQLEDEKDRLKARIWLSGNEGSVTVRIDTIRDSLPAALDLAGEMLKSPSFPADELDVIRQQALAQLEERSQDPSSRGFNELQRTLQPWPSDDPRAILSEAEQIAKWNKLKLADLKAYHRDFWGAGKGELVVIGDFDSQALTAQVEALFGSWKSKQPYQRMAEKRFGVAATTTQIDIKDKEMALLAVGHDLELQDTDPDYPAAQLAGFIAGGSLGSRLWTRLREKEGFSYGTGAWLYGSAFAKVGGFGGFAVMAPSNLASGKAALLEELRRLVDHGVDDAELARMKQAWVEQQVNALADDGGFANVLGQLLFQGRDLGWVRDRQAAISALTAAQVSAAAKKYILPDRLIVIEAADFAKIKGN
jgi:zinc protease